jgi:serine phosphatase RsbU (regulator of sigma subunit)
MGKGMPAALLMATARGALRSVADVPPAQAVTAVNHTLFADLSVSNSFVTLFYTHLDPATGVLSYVDAGHGLALIQRWDGSVEPLRQSSLPMGVLSDTVYAQGSATLAPGETLVVYSDGLPDARSDLSLGPDGIAAHLDGVVSAQEKLERLMGVALAGSARPDDLTLVLVRRVD